MAKNGYFGPEFFRFFKELAANNRREWFLDNKTRYEHEVRDPFLRLIADIGPGLRKIEPHYVADPNPNRGSMMRIYRDIRFSKDKRPYNTNVRAHFGHAMVNDGSAPAFYLRLEPDGSMIGGGFWRPEPEELKKVRDMIVAEPKAWRRVTSGHHFGTGCKMAGESLKRAPAGYDPMHPLIEDIKRKDFAVSSGLTDREVCSPNFLELVLERLRATAPFIKFLSSAVGLP